VKLEAAKQFVFVFVISKLQISHQSLLLWTLKMSMKTPIVWNITPCSPLKANRRFGEICHLHIKINKARNKHAAGSKQSWRWQATYSSETSVDFERTVRCYIPEVVLFISSLCETELLHLKLSDRFVHCRYRVRFLAQMSDIKNIFSWLSSIVKDKCWNSIFNGPVLFFSRPS
jgi:hypothetical protein